jgi:hypothetical protein
MPSFRGNAHTDTFEWVSGADLINSAHMLMGGIDLDPASSAVANSYVNAEHFYTPEDDGLNEQDWFGNVYVFPPNYTYFWDIKSQRWKRTRGLSHTLISGYALWWRTLKRKWLSGEIRQGLYFGNCPDMIRYAQDIFDFPICFLKNTPMLRRHYFEDGRVEAKNTCSSFIVYLQPSDDLDDYTQNFIDIYSEKGRIIV